MIRNLKFDLDVDTNALLCPNPDEFYSKAYLTRHRGQLPHFARHQKCH